MKARGDPGSGRVVTIEEFFAGRDESRRIYDAICATVYDVGPAAVRVGKSQIAFRRRIGFAFVWVPGVYLPRASIPLVLTIGLRRRDHSPRWKELVEPAPGRFTHHLELTDPADVDGEVREWLREAWEAAA